MTNKERLILILLAAVNFTHIMDFMIMMPLGPQFMTLFQISPQQFSFAVSAYALTAGVSGFVAAFFVDRYDRKTVLMFAYAGFLAGTFACALAPTYYALVGARVLAGFFGGMIGAQVLSIVGDSIPYERRAQAMGIVMTAFSFASVAGVPVGLWLATRYSWHAPFLLIGFLGLAILAAIFYYMPGYRKHLEGLSGTKQSPLHVLTDIWASPNQRRALTLTSTLMVGHFSIIPFITPYLVGNVGYSQADIFLVYLVGGVATLISAPLIGRFADKHGKYPIFALFALLSIVPVWLITNLWPMPAWGVLSISALFFVFVSGRMIPVQAMVSNVVSPQQRGGFMSINSSVQQLGTGLASLMSGAIVVKTTGDRLLHYDWVGYISIALILACLYLASRVKAEGA
jgi:MFS transporter, DHA1 family, inner membrane transport protein